MVLVGLSRRAGRTMVLDPLLLDEDPCALGELALEPFDVAPEAALHVGDLAQADVWGAGRLGFRTVWIDRAQKGWPDSLEGRPTLTVTRLADLLGHV